MSAEARVRPGWKIDPEDDCWWRWWDGTAWHDAFWPRQLKPQSYLPDLPRLRLSSSTDRPWFEVVGEHARAAEIEAALSRAPRLDEEIEWFGEAELVPEPDNPYDNSGMAVSVRVNGYCVGYLPRSAGESYARLVLDCVSRGAVPVVGVRIWAATRRKREGNLTLASAVRLAMPNAERALPVNDPPPAPHFVIPRGRAVQVSGEDEHLEVLRSYIDGDSERAIIVTLHPFEKVTARSSHVLVEVRLDGDRVGQLTPASSRSVLPLIAECEGAGRLAAAWAVLKGSRFAAEVVLRVAKPEDVDSSWPTEEDQFPALHGRTVKVLPKAFRPNMVISDPPSPRAFGALGWTLIAIGLFVLLSVPYVGILLLLAAMVGVFFWSRARGRRAPTSAHPNRV